MSKRVEDKLSVLQNLYNQNKDLYDKKYKIYWPDHPEHWNKKVRATRRLLRNIPTIVDNIQSLDLKENAIILDICCGSPVLLNEIKNKFPHYKTYGVDIYTTEFEDFEKNCSNGVKVFKFPFQMLLEDSCKFDVVIMFNSFRKMDTELKEQITDWCENNSKYSFLDSMGARKNYE